LPLVAPAPLALRRQVQQPLVLGVQAQQGFPKRLCILLLRALPVIIC
jgi:hypothetical protein